MLSLPLPSKGRIKEYTLGSKEIEQHAATHTQHTNKQIMSDNDHNNDTAMHAVGS